MNTPVLVPAKRRRRSAGMLDRMPCRLEQQPMLRIHEYGFTRRHPEKRCVKIVDVLDEPGAAGDELSRRVRIGVVELVEVPPIAGNLRHRIAPLPQHIPEFVRIGGTRKSRRVADDRKTVSHGRRP